MAHAFAEVIVKPGTIMTHEYEYTSFVVQLSFKYLPLFFPYLGRQAEVLKSLKLTLTRLNVKIFLWLKTIVCCCLNFICLLLSK